MENTERNENCPCVRNCPRHGNCTVCKEAHRGSPLPTACEELEQKQKQAADEANS